MPTALFPSQIATDAQLKVAANLIETKLRIAISATDTVLFVASTAGFAPNMLVSIDKEIIAIGAVSPAPDSTLTVASGGRGFDGTAAASHAAGVKVSLLIDAWHHNALAAEVTAIQATLGTNLANITLGGINSSLYNFPAQSPGGSLVVGNNSITIAPVPLGVSGSNTNHYLYISGGTGANEAVLITGGSAVSGQASGTLIVNCANAHSGAWTIQSASQGIQEALNSLPAAGGEVQVPAGNLYIAAPITVAVQGARIRGVSRNNSASLLERTSGVLFNVTANQVEITTLSLRGGGPAAPAGNIAIQVSGWQCYCHSLMLDLFYGGILHTAGFHSIFRDIWANSMSGYVCKHTGGVSPYFETITHNTNPAYDVPSEGGIVINASGAYVLNCDILRCRYGVLVQPVAERLEWTFIYDCRFDQSYAVGVYILNASASALEGVYLHDVWSATAGQFGTLAGAPPTSGVGLQIENTGLGTIKEVVVEGGQIFNSRDSNIKIHSGKNVKIDGVRLNWCNVGSTGGVDNIYAASPDRVEIVDCEIGSNWPASTNVRAGIMAAATTGDLLIRDCRFDQSNGIFSYGEPIANLASNLANVKTDGFNRGSDDIAHEGVASAATVTLSPRQYHHITGTTNINTILPTWQGRKLYLFNPDAGSWQLTSAGNIAGPVTVSSGQNVVLTFTGNKWLVGT